VLRLLRRRQLSMVILIIVHTRKKIPKICSPIIPHMASVIVHRRHPARPRPVHQVVRIQIQIQIIHQVFRVLNVYHHRYYRQQIPTQRTIIIRIQSKIKCPIVLLSRRRLWSKTLHPHIPIILILILIITLIIKLRCSLFNSINPYHKHHHIIMLNHNHH